VRARQVGSKSASELMDPRLLVEESFAFMNSHAEGRAQLDRLADVITDEFRSAASHALLPHAFCCEY